MQHIWIYCAGKLRLQLPLYRWMLHVWSVAKVEKLKGTRLRRSVSETVTSLVDVKGEQISFRQLFRINLLNHLNSCITCLEQYFANNWNLNKSLSHYVWWRTACKLTTTSASTTSTLAVLTIHINYSILSMQRLLKIFTSRSEQHSDVMYSPYDSSKLICQTEHSFFCCISTFHLQLQWWLETHTDSKRSKISQVSYSKSAHIFNMYVH